jgi:hypothetical protein
MSDALESTRDCRAALRTPTWMTLECSRIRRLLVVESHDVCSL